MTFKLCFLAIVFNFIYRTGIAINMRSYYSKLFYRLWQLQFWFHLLLNIQDEYQQRLVYISPKRC